MNKMWQLLLMILFSVILISGCSNNKEMDNDLSFSEWAKENLKFDNEIKKIKCSEINENSIMSGSNTIFITNNKIYKYDVDRLFSNNKNCKLIGNFEETVLIAVSKDNAIDEKGILYNDFWQKIEDENYDGNYERDILHTGWKEYLKRFNINEQMVSANDNLSIYHQKNIPNYEIITYTNDGLYLYNINYQSVYNGDGESQVYKVNTDFLNDEKIINIYGSIVKTNQAFYTLSSDVVNKEECDKYADINCEYDYNLKKDEILTKYYDEILNITNNYFITNDYELISISGYYHTS